MPNLTRQTLEDARKLLDKASAVLEIVETPGDALETENQGRSREEIWDAYRVQKRRYEKATKWRDPATMTPAPTQPILVRVEKDGQPYVRLVIYDEDKTIETVPGALPIPSSDKVTGWLPVPAL